MKKVPILTKEQQYIIDEMSAMGFRENQDESMVFTHPLLSRHVFFDLSASGSGIPDIMSHIFQTCINEGKKQKQLEIKQVLGL